MPSSGEGDHRFVAGDRVLVVANPATRSDARSIVRLLEREAPEGIRLDVCWTEGPRQARQLAERHLAGAAAVIAVGGDGTVSEVAGALVGTEIPLGVVPGGSTNIVAREAGVPSRHHAAVQLLFSSHRVRSIDVGICNDHAFLHMAGAGFDSRMFTLADPRLKRKVGWPAYLPAAMRALRDPAEHYVIDADGDTFEVWSPLVLVANGASIVDPRIRLLPDIRNDDGWLDLIVVTATRPTELARVIGRVATLQLHRSPFVRRMRARAITLQARRPVPVELDGDVVTGTPARFGVLPRAVRLICAV